MPFAGYAPSVSAIVATFGLPGSFLAADAPASGGAEVGFRPSEVTLCGEAAAAGARKSACRWMGKTHRPPWYREGRFR